MSRLKICVYGTGAIDGHIAARLALGGAETAVIARGAQLEAIATNGITIRMPEEPFTMRVDHATDDPATLGAQDHVIVCVKTPALPEIAARISPLLGPHTTVSFMINGIPWWYCHGLDGLTLPQLDPTGILQREIGANRTLGGIVYSGCTVVAPGVIKVEHDRNRLVIGELDGSLSPRAQELADVLSVGGMGMEISPDIRHAVWAKLLINLGSAPLAVLSGQPMRDNLVEPAIETAVCAIYAEATAIAAALGITLTADPMQAMAANRKSGHKPSMLQDYERGRAMEVSTLLDAPLALARLKNIPTPTLDLITAFVRLRARAKGVLA